MATNRFLVNRKPRETKPKRPPFGGYYRWREMMDKLELWPEDKAEKWQDRELEI
jgi:hypothetical protein